MRLSPSLRPRFVRRTVPHSPIRVRRSSATFSGAAIDESQAARLAPTTKRVLDEIDERKRRRSSKSKAQEREKQAGGAGGATTWDALLRADRAWGSFKEAALAAKSGGSAASPPPPEFVSVRTLESVKQVVETTPSFDVAVAGGTLGVILAAALTSAGLRVAVVEAGPLKGREQEWNICREELEALVESGALSADDASGAVVAEFNPVRCAFSKRPGDETAVSVVTTDVLNLGVSPDRLIKGARRVVERGSGEIFEFWPLKGVSICSDGVVLHHVGENEQEEKASAITAKLFIDCMGSGSPAARQARSIKAGGRAVIPDGVCMVAGTCASGPWPHDDVASPPPSSPPPSSPSPSSPSSPSQADVIAAIDGAALGEGVAVPGQFFWESFVASEPGGGESDDDGGENQQSPKTRSAKTTYMFQYSDLDRSDLRPSLVEFVEEYWKRVRPYQGLDAAPQKLFLENAPFVVERVLFGVFYTYRDSPLRAPSTWDRFLFAGDAAGLQSPLSFGGLGSLTRHAKRIRNAVAEALTCDATRSSDLALINSCYSPNLSGSWMLQRAMAARPESPPPYEDFVVDLLQANFKAMSSLGDETLRPFLRDVVRLDGLSATLLKQVLDRPDLVFSIVRHVGLPALLDWTRHYVALALYTALAGAFAKPLLGGDGGGGDETGKRKVGAIESCSLLDAKAKFRLRRTVEAWQYGSGLDWVYKKPSGAGGRGETMK